MDWIETPDSSNIAQIAYDNATHVLSVQFKQGATYNYFDVPPRLFEALRDASSKGQFLAQSIKGHYRYARA